MFERFTDRARRALLEAQAESVENRHGFIGTEHILIGLVREGDGLASQALAAHGVALAPLREKVAARIEEFVDPKRHELSEKDALAAIGIDLDSVRTRLEDTFGPGALLDPHTTPPFTPKAKDSLEHALKRALMLRHRYIGTEHELLGLLGLRDGVACSALLDLGVDLDALDADVVNQAAPEQARVAAAWKAAVELQLHIQSLPQHQRIAAQEAMTELGRVRDQSMVDEQSAVARAATDAADRLEAAIESTRRALADLGIAT